MVLDKKEIKSRYEISKPVYGDGYNISLKLGKDELLTSFVSKKEDLAARVDNIREFAGDEINFHVIKMDEEEGFFFKLSKSDKLYRGDILASSDIFDFRSEVESLIKRVIRESQTVEVVDNPE
ncbi:hypothetical protein [Pseudoalteromonas peptidolytica]|uniref:Uncharacterized protein n=1 Tax=Pseudoalteromonas peptidolytica F12-50-A1 TaxID=1315280 RepID=A0A8I0MXG8_9GAMM|nr:hypothetical protein [Pseudoalteromonas peptidolytica]MBE0347690.1 hypothetical protein [Pseudoalteromonas peptidolytica F12-50-A1]NLR16134.1 hypothetical protein [Pseudoalteromonas peptidolytica]GEK11685.1 hypothetical protein PPE03_39340 [Pseudoalteromonas peptidolytica]